MKKYIKKCLSIFLSAVMIAAAMGSMAWADEIEQADDSAYDFKLTVSGAKSATVAPGEAVDVSVSLEQQGGGDTFVMYAASYVLQYDTAFFDMESAPDFGQADSRGVTYMYSDDTGRDGWSAVTVSVKSPSFEGSEWSSPSELLAFKLRAKKAGASAIQCSSAAMGNIYGGRYPTESNNAVVTIVNRDSSSGGEDKPSSGGGSSSGGSSGSNNTSGGNSSAGAAQPGSASPDASGAADDKAQDTVETAAFSDVAPTAWYAEPVSYVTSKGLFTGTGGGKFSPDGDMNRAMLVTVLWRLAGSPQSAQASSFKDVAQGSWYAQAVAWASSNGIVNGVSDDSFAPSASVTREQIAAMLYRYAQRAGADASYAGNLSGFRDAASVSSWAAQPVQWTIDKKIMNGVTSDTLAPGRNATRAQVASMIMRYAGAAS